VVVFGAALTRAPLTTDRVMLTCWSIRWSQRAPDGTAIGVALAPAARLKDSEAKSKVVVLVTDGVNNAGEIDPLSAPRWPRASASRCTPSASAPKVARRCRSRSPIR
jgi:Ca-activated chloride channel family protein